MDVQSGLSLLEVSVRQGLVPPNELEQEPEVRALCTLYGRERREYYHAAVAGLKQALYRLVDGFDGKEVPVCYWKGICPTRLPSVCQVASSSDPTMRGNTTCSHGRQRYVCLGIVDARHRPTIGRDSVRGLGCCVVLVK